MGRKLGSRLPLIYLRKERDVMSTYSALCFYKPHRQNTIAKHGCYLFIQLLFKLFYSCKEKYYRRACIERGVFVLLV